MAEPAAAGDDLAFWAALPAAARMRIAHALRQGESKPREGAEAGGGDGKDGTIDAKSNPDDNEKAQNLPPSSFRAPPRGGASVVHALVPSSTAAQAALELDDLLKERGRAGGVAGV